MLRMIYFIIDYSKLVDKKIHRMSIYLIKYSICLIYFTIAVLIYNFQKAWIIATYYVSKDL
jgi:Cu/Ag efflux pump CusA